MMHAMHSFLMQTWICHVHYNYTVKVDRFLESYHLFRVSQKVRKFEIEITPEMFGIEVQVGDFPELEHVLTLLDLKHLFNLSTGKTVISYIVPKLWNSIPRSIKRSESIESFKNNFKDYLMLTEGSFCFEFSIIRYSGLGRRLVWLVTGGGGGGRKVLAFYCSFSFVDILGFKFGHEYCDRFLDRTLWKTSLFC